MKTVFITGVGRGIGKALARRFVDDGYNVIGTTQSGNADYSSPNLKILKLDLVSQQLIDECIHNIDEKIDILINNAGVLLDDNETTVGIDKLRQTLEVNLIGTINLTEHLIGKIANDGHIINISSSAGSLTEASDLGTSHFPYHHPAYKISKAAINMYTRTLANRFGKENLGIIVSSVHPGWVKTDMGGSEAPISPEEAAHHIFKLAVSRPETGQFWYKGEKYPW